MSKVLAYHVVFCMRGFWLPNDPRGSGSTEVRFEPLRKFGPATKLETRQSVAGIPHDRAKRKAAKREMVLPEVILDGKQAQSIGRGFAEQTAKSGYRIHACTIMPAHVHMVIARHIYAVEQVVRLLRQAGTRRLLADGRHPFADLRGKVGRLPSVWAQDQWKVFLFDAEQIRNRIEYVEQNPIKEGKPAQGWKFVCPFDESDPISDAS
jgi:REP element-mobilizing transposase RayT